jgi:hypothetical protein
MATNITTKHRPIIASMDSVTDKTRPGVFCAASDTFTISIDHAIIA